VSVVRFRPWAFSLPDSLPRQLSASNLQVIPSNSTFSRRISRPQLFFRGRVSNASYTTHTG
ncbi:MAG: hypothetical protein KDD42_04945, partial [Bdellovibrionales bacterium]|nr:hypothetical protein [Bdellovibrionales bacterium]